MTTSIESVAEGVLESLHVGKTPAYRMEIARKLLKQLRACGVVIARPAGGDSDDGDPRMSLEDAISSLEYLVGCRCGPQWVLKGMHDPMNACRSYQPEMDIIKTALRERDKEILDLKIAGVEAGERNKDLLTRIKLLASRRP